MTPITPSPIAGRTKAGAAPDSADIHSCSYFCLKAECIRAQRDELCAHVAELQDNGRRLQEVADGAAAECLELRKQLAAFEPVGWQWLNSAHFRRKLSKDAERGAWRQVFARKD